MSSYSKHREHLEKFGVETGLYPNKESQQHDLDIIEGEGMLLTDGVFDRYAKGGKEIPFTEPG